MYLHSKWLPFLVAGEGLRPLNPRRFAAAPLFGFLRAKPYLYID